MKVLWPFLVTLACGAPTRGASGDGTEHAMNQQTTPALVESTLSVQRGEATATVVVRAEGPVADSPHVVVAAAQAWLLSGRARLSAGDAAGAWAASQSGLTELGSRYLDPVKVDDTGQKLAAAKMSFDEGDVADAATVALGALESRIRQYQRRYAAEVVRVGG